MKLSVCTNNGGMIGTDLEEVSLLYSFKADLENFKKITSKGEDAHIVMGRKTYDTIGRPLPKRTNIIISRQKDLEIPGCRVMTLDDFISEFKDHPNMWVIGGSQIYTALLPYVDEAYVTHVSDPNQLALEHKYTDTLVYMRNTLKKILNTFNPIETTPWTKEENRITGESHMIVFMKYEKR